MRYNILQLLKNLRLHSNGKEITDVDILEWANAKVRNNGCKTRMYSFRVSTLLLHLFYIHNPYDTPLLPGLSFEPHMLLTNKE